MRDAIPVIAIDGPAASGKGTLAAQLCRRLLWYRLDSGLLYRIVGYVLHTRGVDTKDKVAVQDFLLDTLSIDVRWDDSGANEYSSLVTVAAALDGNEHVVVNGTDVTRKVRSNENAAMASLVATMEPVRSFLIPIQRSFRHTPGLVADGRDMGTVVFPDAIVKIFLTANLKQRARRRQMQLHLEDETSLSDLEKSLRQRDRQDMERSLAPLKPSLDAIHIDSSELSIEQMTDWAIDICRSHSLC